MQKYHLTIIRNGLYETVFIDGDIESFLAVETALCREVHVLYSREISKDQYEYALKNIKN